MRDDLVDLVQDAAAEPLQQPDFDAMAARGRRQRTMTQVIGGAASALVLLVAGVVFWPSPSAESPVISDAPADRADGELAELPDGWQWVQVGQAQFGIPGDWQAIETTEEIAAHCSLYYTTPPMALTGPAPAPISCPAPDVTHPGPGLRATTLTASSGMTPPAEADTVDVNGWAAQRWTETRTTAVNGDIVEGQFAVYRVDALDLYIKVRTDSAPNLADQIMATLSSIAGTPSTQAPSEGDGGEPYDVDAQMRPDLMVATPDPAAPDETVELTFPEETSRGVAFVLERQLPDGSWDHVYFLIASRADGPDIRPEWFPADQPPNWSAGGVVGPGPDRVVVPATAEPGDYRICTANAGDEFCTPLRVEAQGSSAAPTATDLEPGVFVSDSVAIAGEQPDPFRGTEVVLEVSLVESQAWVSWRADCNTGSAPAQLDDGRLELTDDVLHTAMACENERQTEQDERLSDFFMDEPQWAQDGNRLRVSSTDGSSELVLTKQPDAEG